MKAALRYLLGGDWNEPPFAKGRYTAAWIASMTGGKIAHGGAGAMGRIDFVVTDAQVYEMTLNGTGGSDHNLRSFTVRPFPEHPGLRGAIWNVQRDRNPADFMPFLKAALKLNRLDFVLLQEIQQYHHALGSIPGYRLFAQPGRGINQNGILVRDGVKATGFRVKKMAPWTWRTGTGAEHAPQYMPHVCLDGWIRVGSVHEMSKIDWHDGRMKGPRDRRRIRAAAARRMVRWVGHLRAGVYDR